jgi:hypothetical protein
LLAVAVVDSLEAAAAAVVDSEQMLQDKLQVVGHPPKLFLLVKQAQITQ